MKVNIVSCTFILESEKNENIRKNDIKKIKVLVDKNNLLPKFKYLDNDMKEQIREKVFNILNTDRFHLEQVFTFGLKNEIDILYLGVSSRENIDLEDKYKLIDFKIENNNQIIFGDNKYNYKTEEIEKNNNIEYIHSINVHNKTLEKELIYLITSFKKIRSNIDNSDIIFKFLGEVFTLEDVRLVYELIKDTKTDKANFRKKIIKYCEEVNINDSLKSGYRPSKRYKFKPLKGDIWI